MLKTVGNPSTRSGDQTIVGGNLVIGTAGNGIDFSADPSAPGMTSELLDDYEEGTWTVQFYDDNSGGNVSPTTATGYYTKIGRLVSCNFNVDNINTTGMTAGNVFWFTLPFASNANLGRNAGSVLLASVTYPTSRTQVNSYVNSNSSRGSFIGTGSNLATSSVTVADITSGSDDVIACSITYSV
jgi:hypothetical protein